MGVADQERALIFQRFHRGGAARPGFRGTGMGLSICQTIVQRHGGSIECLAAAPGPGTGFRFDLPAAAAEPGSDVAPVLPADLEERLGDLLERADASRVHQHREDVVA